MFRVALQRAHNLTNGSLSCRVIPSAGLKDWKPEPEKDVEYPPYDTEAKDRRKFRLGLLEKRPMVLETPENMQKNLREMRGPEEVHNELLHKQFGIQALQGGRMKYGHFEMLRNGFNRHVDLKRVFAVWRIDAPWRPLHKKGVSMTLGGGRKKATDFCTPLKANRIIIEVGGDVEYFELKHLLNRLANKLPFKARPVTYEQMIEEAEREKELEAKNLNMFTFKHSLSNNLVGSKDWCSPYDMKWWGKYR